MPPQDRVRLNDAGQTEQAWPEPGHPYQQRPVTPTQPQTVRCTPQGNIELMPKKEVLDFKPAPRLEQIDDKRPKRVEDGSIDPKDALILPHRANPAGWNFRERQPRCPCAQSLHHSSRADAYRAHPTITSFI